MNTSNRPYKCLLFGLILMLSACTGTPTREVSPVVTPQSQFFSDDFTHPHSDWARFDIEAGAAYIHNEEFFLEDRGKNIAIYSPLVNQKYEDVRISLAVRHVQGSMDNWMGVICRQQDEGNYYLLAISADGYYLIQRVENNEELALSGPEISEAIHNGKVSNQLEATCQGSHLSLRVNGELLATVSDVALSKAGQVAVFADAVPGGGTTTVAFDNFTLSTP
ncbi:MAG: hypothetical protein JXA21_29480 [Anaerolineae bacterium]|nr:hypothetical protein [Anaerolineae bacterium]